MPRRPLATRLETSKVYMVPCSCGTTFSIAQNRDCHGTSWSRYFQCPSCGKRHDPKNHLLRLDYRPERYWQVDAC